MFSVIITNYIIPVIIGFLLGGIYGAFSRGDLKKTTLGILAGFFTPEAFLLLFTEDVTLQLMYGAFYLSLLLGFIFGYRMWGRFKTGAAAITFRPSRRL